MTNAQIDKDHQTIARELVAAMDANNGLAPVDIERFWADNEIAVSDPFADHIPQLPFGAYTTGECVFDELGVVEDHWRYQHDQAWRLELNKAYNNKAQAIVGKRLLSEARYSEELQYPPVKGLADVFEAENKWHGQSWWLMQSVHGEDELKALLDRVEQRDIRSFILPDNWQDEKARLLSRGIKPPLYRHQRGPCTFATSIYGVENLLFLLLDNLDLAERLRDAILRVMLDIARVLDEETGYTPASAPRGFHFFDDNCCLLNRDMYELFGYPILKGVFDRYAPDADDTRYQHSDSPMGHLLPIFAALNMTSVNFGPTVMADDIRAHLPKATIHGVLAPFAYCRNEHENIVCQLLRDFEMTRATRGLVFATAGSVNNGTLLTSMRLVMSAIQRHARYSASS